MNGIDNQVVLVTGASRGIGLGIAKAFVDNGAEVHALAEDSNIEQAASVIGATPHVADITDERVIERLGMSIGKVDILINNAGLERLTPIDETDAETLALFRRIIDINVVGTRIVTSCMCVNMVEGSRIINTASVWGRVAEPLFDAYVASKHAVIGMTKTWARELGPRGIRVNAVAPGWVRTQASVRSVRSLAVRSGKPESGVIADVSDAQALGGGLMEPEDITGAYLFLASELSANVTGQTLGIDRGEVPW